MSRLHFVRAPRLLAALLIGSSAAARKARCRRADAAQTPATTAAEPTPGERNRRHRLAHPPRPAERRTRRSCSSTRTTSPRPASTRSTTCSSACPARAAASTASSTIRATSATRPTAAASAPARPKSTCATSARAACSCWSTASASSTAPRPAASRARPTSTRFPKARSSGSRCCRTAPRRFTARTRSPASSTSSPRSARRASIASRPARRLSSEGDGFTQNYQLSWGNGGDGPLQFVVGGNYVKQDPVSSADRAISRFPAPYSDTCADGGCSGFTADAAASPLRSACLGRRTATLIAPVTRPRRSDDPADFRRVRQPGRPLQLRAVQLHPDPARALRRVRQRHAMNWPTTSTSRPRRIWNQRKSKNQAAPLPFGVGPSAGIDAGARRDRRRRDQPVQPVRRRLSIADATRQSRHLPPLRRRRPAPVQPDGRHHLWRRARSTASSTSADDDWFWDVNAAYGRNKAKQTMFGNINSGQSAPGARAGRRPAPRPACRSTCSAAPARSPRR